MTDMNNQIERRALYTLLRMNWLQDSSMSAEQWQIEDYSSIPTSTLFDRLNAFQIQLDSASLHAYAEECDSPEDYVDFLTADRPFSHEEEDQIYLIVFELWQRFLSEKLCLSTLCYQIDLQISLFNQGNLYNARLLQDLLSQMIQILKNSSDEGINPEEAFSSVSRYFANELSTFLYDYISEQLNNDTLNYANELIEDLGIFLKSDKWFDLIKLRINGQNPQKRIAQIIEENYIENDLEFDLEFLSLLVVIGDLGSFKKTLEATLPLLKFEEDFHDLLQICADFYHRLDQENIESVLISLLKRRQSMPLSNQIVPSDPGISLLKQILSL